MADALAVYFALKAHGETPSSLVWYTTVSDGTIWAEKYTGLDDEIDPPTPYEIK